MFVIRQAQIEVLHEALMQRFVGRLVAHLRAIYPDHVPADDADLTRLVQAGIEQSITYGVVVDADLVRYLEYMVYFGADFDLKPEFYVLREILRDEYLSGTEKMDSIDALVTVQYQHMGEQNA